MRSATEVVSKSRFQDVGHVPWDSYMAQRKAPCCGSQRGSGRYQKTGTYMPVTYEHVLMALNTDILCLSCVQKYLCALLFPQKVV